MLPNHDAHHNFVCIPFWTCYQAQLPSISCHNFDEMKATEAQQFWGVAFWHSVQNQVPWCLLHLETTGPWPYSRLHSAGGTRWSINQTKLCISICGCMRQPT